jgi:tetrapyrrole methylase family protein / MazG family protein
MPPRKSRRKPSKAFKSRKKGKSCSQIGRDFDKLVAVMVRLRAPGGCPWDREQTHATLRTYLIEEAYEVLDALDSADDAKFTEELGDLLLQVLFHAQIAREQNRFSITDVIREIHDKMVRRHPHVFGTTSAKTAADVLRNWEIIKKEERAKSGANSRAISAESYLDGVPRTLPAVLEALQLTRKAARIGFDWPNIDGIFAKLAEETHELRQALAHSEKDTSHIESELGDLLFVAVNLARFLHVDPELTLKQASAKFTRRFHQMERFAHEQGTTLAQIPRDHLESLWDRAKLFEQSTGRS